MFHLINLAAAHLVFFILLLLDIQYTSWLFWAIYIPLIAASCTFVMYMEWQYIQWKERQKAMMAMEFLKKTMEQFSKNFGAGNEPPNFLPPGESE